MLRMSISELVFRETLYVDIVPAQLSSLLTLLLVCRGRIAGWMPAFLDQRAVLKASDSHTALLEGKRPLHLSIRVASALRCRWRMKTPLGLVSSAGMNSHDVTEVQRCVA